MALEQPGWSLYKRPANPCAYTSHPTLSPAGGQSGHGNPWKWTGPVGRGTAAATEDVGVGELEVGLATTNAAASAIPITYQRQTYGHRPEIIS